MTAPEAAVAAVMEAHSIAAFAGCDTACSCDRRWRTNTAWRKHVAEHVTRAAVDAARPSIQADALREAAQDAIDTGVVKSGDRVWTAWLRARADRIEGAS